MRIIETTVYKFDELTQQGQEKAISNLYDINVDYEWYQFTYEDAENIGLKITSFDERNISGFFRYTAKFTADSIMENHGSTCETYKTAQDYLISLAAETEKNLIINAHEEYPEDFLNLEEINNEFLKSLLEDYRIMLNKEYEYLTSNEAIIETIEANEYEFTYEGKLV